MPRTIFVKNAFALAVVALAMTSALAQEKYPSRPIEMVIPTAAGGGTDISLRMLAELAEPALGQKIVVVNKTGGGGTVGMAGIVGAKPDGYTIGGLWNAPLTMTPHMLPAPYKPSDYAAVTLATWAPTVLCVKAAFPANDGKSFMGSFAIAPGTSARVRAEPKSVVTAHTKSTATIGTPSAIQEKNGRGTCSSRRMKPMPIKFGGVPTGVPRPPIEAAKALESSSAAP